MQHQRFPMWTGLILAAVLACGDDSSKPTVAAYCANICARSEKAACKGDTGDCDTQCADQFADTPARCDSQQDELLRCASRADFVCDSNDESDAPDCAAKVTAYTKCIGGASTGGDGGTSSGTDAGGNHDAGVADAGKTDASTTVGDDSGVTVSAELKALCAAQCKTVIATGCANDGTQASCVASCEDTVASYGNTCATEVKAAVTCFRDASYTCDATSGTAGTKTCNTQIAALKTCDTGGTTAMCDVPANPTACQTCAATNCCAEREACGSDCLALDSCYAACATGDNTCLDTCDTNASDAAYNAADALYTCLDANCTSSC